jgi:outer membrane receptor protein involved in Fe transport
MTRSRLRKLRRARAVLTSVPLASVMLAAMPALAQERGVLEEVVVSAQKRSENLQDVPLSIQALGTVKLEEMHVNSFNDYAKLLPSVAYQSAGPGFARVYMRGVASGDNGNHSGPLPSVGTYLDEQPITTIQGALDLHVYDVARVEALAGPQGTLYGASSQAGTIRIITNKPDPSAFKAGYDLQGTSISGGGGGYIAEGFVNLPLTQSAAIRLVGWSEHDAGYIDNVAGTLTYAAVEDGSGPLGGPGRGPICISNTNTPGCIATPNHPKKDYNDVDTYGARAALKVDLNDSWTITPAIMAQTTEAKGIFGFNPALGDLKVAHFYPEKSKDTWVQAALTVEGKIGNFDLVYAGSYLKRHDETASDYTDYSSFYDYYGSYFFDNSGTLINPSQRIEGRDLYTKTSHELRISSPSTDRLRFVAGLFMQRQTHNIQQVYLVDDLATQLSVTGWPDAWWLTKQERVDRDYAVFGEVTYDLTEKLSLTGGIRFFRAKNSLEGFYGFSLNNDFTSATGEKSCDPALTTIAGVPCSNLKKEVKEDGNTPRINLTYRFTADALVYATYSEGFRPGGVNRRGTFPPYKSDYLKNYEVGWKSSWAGNRLRFNGALFVEDWKDFQFSYLGLNALTQVVNAGGARIKGLEADINWAATDSLQLSGGMAWMQAELTQFFCQNVDPSGVPLPPDQCEAANSAPSGTMLPVTPKFKANLTARYGFGIGQYDAHVQGTYAYQSLSASALLQSERDILGDQKAYGVFDFTVGIDVGSISVELFANNAFDERADIYRYSECDPTKCGAVATYIVPNMPRQIGLKFGQKF